MTDAIEVLRAANAAVATPEDTILITFNRGLSTDDHEHVLSELRKAINPAIKIVVVDRVQSVTVVKG